MFIYVCMCVWRVTYVYTPDVSVDYLAQSHVTPFFFETVSVTDPGTHWVREIGWH